MNIAIIENLGVLDDIYEALDFTDNDLVKLEGFPLLSRLDTLQAANNQISKIASNLAETLPNLTTLNLHNNKIASFIDLLPLRELKELRMLNLCNNPVILKHVNWKVITLIIIPHLTYINFENVTDEMRAQAKAMSRKIKKGASLESFLVVDMGYMRQQLPRPAPTAAATAPGTAMNDPGAVVESVQKESGMGEGSGSGSEEQEGVGQGSAAGKVGVGAGGTAEVTMTDGVVVGQNQHEVGSGVTIGNQ